MAALRKAGRKYAKAQAARMAALAELQDALRAADAEGGHSRLSLVEAAGVAKQTVYDALAKPAAGSAGAPADAAGA
jgi:hypothetical protein